MSANYNITATGGTSDYREAFIIEAGDQKLIKGDEWGDPDCFIDRLEIRVRAPYLADIRVSLDDANGNFSHIHEFLFCGIFVAHWPSDNCPDET